MAITTGDVLGWWDWQEGSGTTVADEISVSPTDFALVNTPTWITGGPTNLPNGVDFNGSTQYGNAVKDYDFSVGSMSVWFNPDVVNVGQLIFGNGGFGGVGEGDIFTASSSLFGRTRLGVSDQQVTSGVSATTLYHAVWCIEAGNLELFINGSSVGTNTTNTGAVTQGSNNLFVARNSNASNNFFNGKIFQTILLSKRLDSTEVNSLYNAGAGTTYAQFFGGGATYSSNLLMLGVT